MPGFLPVSTAKRIALAVALLGVLGAGAAFALAGAPPAPRITSHPATWTRSRNANFRFADSRANVSFKCSLDGARFRTCSSSKGYGGLSDGRHLFRVEAQTS